MSEAIDIYEFSKRTTETKYPYIKVLEPNATTPLIVSVMENGEMPLVIEMNGVKKVVARISMSALNVDRLLRTCGSLELVMNADNTVLVKDVVDYMEVFKWT